MISTSSHKNCDSNKFITYEISGNCGKNPEYRGKSFDTLAPKFSFWKVWHDNIGVVPEEDNNRYYIEQYYNQVLAKLDPEEIYRKLDHSILLCDEDHRHIVAEWLQILLDVEVPEVKINSYEISTVERPSYIRTYLEDAMRKEKNMRGFNSLRALYLFEKGEKLEQLANKLEQEKGENYDGYRQMACYLRCDADEVEEEYNASRLQKVKK